MPHKTSKRVAEVVVVTTAMLTFISFWRAAAVVLCDLASTAYYIGGIAENVIGKSAPWFILAVMLFSYTIRAVYMESCCMFVRGGVYRVVKEAMGGLLAKFSVSSIIFDYVLTGPISAVSAGQYLAGLLNNIFPYLRVDWYIPTNAFAVAFAVLVTLYFWRKNVMGIEESSDKSLRIMMITTVMLVVMAVWGGYTIYVRGLRLPPFELHLSDHSLGWLKEIDWVKASTFMAIAVAFGHSLLGMSGWESMAQVFRELEAPKVKNLKRATLLIFSYSLILTTMSAFFAVMIIPDAIRTVKYSDNLLGGIAMWVEGPFYAQLGFQAFVVIVGCLILSGAVNTAIIGCNGILNRLAEDGVLADWFREIHPRYGTTYRMINFVVLLQIVTILACRGNVFILGEAYAFGVIWSFVFKTLSILVLRFKDKTPREWKVPMNLVVGQTEIPLGLGIIFLILLGVGIVNLYTKPLATVSGFSFTVLFFMVIAGSEYIKARQAAKEDVHLEKFNLRREQDLTAEVAGVGKPNRVLVALRDTGSLHHLKTVLENTDSETTDVVVMTAKIVRTQIPAQVQAEMGHEERLLFTHVISVAEKYGHTVKPIVVVSNDPYYAIAQTAQSVGAQQIVLGRSAKIPPEIQLERMVMTWGSVSVSSEPGVLVRIVWDGKELSYHLT